MAPTESSPWLMDGEASCGVSLLPRRAAWPLRLFLWSSSGKQNSTPVERSGYKYPGCAFICLNLEELRLFWDSWFPSLEHMAWAVPADVMG